MAKVLVTFLGTTDYLPCNYYLWGTSRRVNEVCFIQEALAELLCDSWTDRDKILVFLTPEAESKNWLDRGNGDDPYSQFSGLSARLDALKKAGRLHCPVIPVPGIPSGHTPEEIWILFNLLLQYLNVEDVVTFDITHSFRSIPIMVMSFLTYARLVKSIHMEKIVYGAFETLGNAAQVRAMPLEERNAPIVDVTEIIRLQDWTENVTTFLRSGDASGIHQMVREEKDRLFRNSCTSKTQREALVILSDLSGLLTSFTNRIRAARGRKIWECKEKEELEKVFARAREVSRYLPPLAAFWDQIEAVFRPFKTDSLDNGFEAARWCVKNGLTPQAYTLIQEFMYTRILIQAGCPWNDLKHREAVSYAFYILSNDRETCDLRSASPEIQKAFPKIRAAVEQLPTKVVRLIGGVVKMRRNDINHGGFAASSVDAELLVKDLQKILNELDSAHESAVEIEPHGASATLTDRHCVRMPLIFNHHLTAEQETDARSHWSVKMFIPLPPELQSFWSQIPPEGPLPLESLENIVCWIESNSTVGDPVLVQGDFGAVTFVVGRLQTLGRIPVYATTRREATESEESDGSIRIEHCFRHIVFRAYPANNGPCTQGHPPDEPFL